jgi:hypothetical protein
MKMPFTKDDWRWILGIIVIPLMGWIWTQHEQQLAQDDAATRQKFDDAQRRNAMVVTLLPYLADTEPAHVKRDLALQLLAQMRKENQLTPELESGLKVVTSRLDPANPSDLPILTNLALLQDRPTANIGNAATSPVASAPKGAAPAPVEPLSLPARIYIQVFGQDEMDSARKAQETLRKQGVIVPGIEDVMLKQSKGQRVPTGFPQLTLLYFNEQDKSLATRMADVLRDTGLGAVRVPDHANTAYRVPNGQLELWFARPASLAN